MLDSWKARAVEKRMQQTLSIPPSWRLSSFPTDPRLNVLQYIESSTLLTPEEHALTSITDGKIIQHKLLTGEVTSETVITAFSKRAAIAQQLTGCCTEMFFDAALNRARELDRPFWKDGKPVGLLHGFPISFKDCFDVLGVDTTVGWVGKIGKPAKRNSMSVELLLRLGAVIYVKTNIPQSLMCVRCPTLIITSSNSLSTLNKSLISGGSSGGERALVGAHASLIGIGTDIGGSIRIPAVLQGLYGMCPSVGRVPNDSSGKTQKYIVPPVAGPITSSLSSLELYFEALLDSNPWERDPQLIPLSWRYNLAKLPTWPLKFAFVFDDGIVRPQPPVERAAREMAAKLKKAGHEVVEWEFSDHLQAYDMWLTSVLSDGGTECEALCRLANEPLVEGMLVGQSGDTLSAAALQQLEERRTAYKRVYLDRWMDSGIDALIMPILPWVGFPPNSWVKSNQCVSYTSQWNFLDYAALAVPATFVDIELDQPSDSWKSHVSRNDADAFNHSQYSVELVKGMPVGLQIVTGRFGEEKAVAIAKVLDNLH